MLFKNTIDSHHPFILTKHAQGIVFFQYLRWLRFFCQFYMMSTCNLFSSITLSSYHIVTVVIDLKTAGTPECPVILAVWVPVGTRGMSQGIPREVPREPTGARTYVK